MNKNALITLEDMELSTRTFNALKDAHVYFAGQLSFYQESELLRIPNLGRKCLTELKKKMNDLDLEIGEVITNHKSYGYTQETFKSTLSQMRKLEVWEARLYSIPNESPIPDRQEVLSTLTALCENSPKTTLQSTQEGTLVTLTIPNRYTQALKNARITSGDLSDEFETAILDVIKQKLKQELGPLGYAQLDLDEMK